MQPVDRTTQMYNVPVGDWVALSPQDQHVLSSGKLLTEVLRAAKEQGEEKPILVKSAAAVMVL